jgi:mRNA interferase MazF
VVAVEPLQGEVWWAELDDPVGSGPGFRRPVIVVAADEFNVSRIATTIVVTVTSNQALAAAPGNVALPAVLTGLPRDSVANVSQIFTIDKARLAECVGHIPGVLAAQIEKGLRLVLGLR